MSFILMSQIPRGEGTFICSNIDCPGLRFFKISRAPLRQYTLPCCCPVPEIQATDPKWKPFAFRRSKTRSHDLIHICTGAVTVKLLLSLCTPPTVLNSGRSFSKFTDVSSTMFILLSIAKAFICWVLRSNPKNKGSVAILINKTRNMSTGSPRNTSFWLLG